ncbi:uncharacterized protein LOC120272591 [Dioscorea cayenensis subsp. rotundata]|uniref:Uncharacterized protein LOC120272591 n=1 Tax=Dioscorea cayennensis subsp. rotundata TaxID=55577 RepID=A0AB40C704_DIOCR|nr:uncharacterized protein LOC120272591 [Dioscorea cayenensis subsp. rotundata]
MEIPARRDQTLVAPSPAFSDTEMATAAALLVQLSSGDVSGAEESAGSSSSFSSIATRPPPRDNEDDDDDGPRRRRPRYRPISVVYAVTSPLSAKRRRIRGT